MNLKELSARNDYEFPYGRTILNAYLIKVTSQYQEADNRKVIMESSRLAVYRCKYLTQIQQYGNGDYLTVDLNKTWFDFRDTIQMFWSD